MTASHASPAVRHDSRDRAATDCIRWLLGGVLILGVWGGAAIPARAQSAVTPAPWYTESVSPKPFDNNAIQVQDLKAPSPLSVGVLSPGQGGFPDSLWKGASSVVVRKLIPMLPGQTASWTIRDLERRLLLSSVTAPEGSDPASRPSLTELRAERLLALGELDGLLKLAEATPSHAAGSTLDRLTLDAALLAGNLPQACDQARHGVAVGNDGVLARITVLCNLAAGKTAEGNMGLDLLRERKEVDPPFVNAAEVLAGLPPIPAAKLKWGEISPLHVVAYDAAHLPLPADVIAKASPQVARAVALGRYNAMDQRVAAGERAESAGTLSVEGLQKLYLEVTFSAEDLAGAMVKAEGPLGRALLYRAATDAADPGIRLSLALKAVDLARNQGQEAAAIRLFSKIFINARSDPAMVSLAPQLARILFVLNRPDLAVFWSNLAGKDPALTRLWPILSVYGVSPGQALPQDGLTAWRGSMNGLPPEVMGRRLAVVLGALSGLGAKIPDAVWLDTLGLPEGGIKVGLYAMLQHSALEAHQGMTVLTGLAALGDVPLDKVDPVILSEVISAFTVVGLTDDARRLAVEAMLANGM